MHYSIPFCINRGVFTQKIQQEQEHKDDALFFLTEKKRNKNRSFVHVEQEGTELPGAAEWAKKNY